MEKHEKVSVLGADEGASTVLARPQIFKGIHTGTLCIFNPTGTVQIIGHFVTFEFKILKILEPSVTPGDSILKNSLLHFLFFLNKIF